MARIAGVDLPRNKRLDVALTYVHGLGKTTVGKILSSLKIDPALKTDQMDEVIVAKIRDFIEKNFAVEGDLRRNVAMNVKRLIELQTYRGLRHRKGLPVRGQRTRSNSRTRKGPRKTVAGKASVKSLK
ncbi:MAG: 30S ribosomal protein S13 [Bdellovibrionales bacterium]|nr:30S ribosomal protein S13 [Bdellovibrionales bacterium]